MYIFTVPEILPGGLTNTWMVPFDLPIQTGSFSPRRRGKKNPQNQKNPPKVTKHIPLGKTV